MFDLNFGKCVSVMFLVRLSDGHNLYVDAVHSNISHR